MVKHYAKFGGRGEMLQYAHMNSWLLARLCEKSSSRIATRFCLATEVRKLRCLNYDYPAIVKNCCIKDEKSSLQDLNRSRLTDKEIKAAE